MSNRLDLSDLLEREDGLEAALSIALAREAAPDDLIPRVEQRLAAPAAAEEPSFRLLSVDTYSRWTALWSAFAHAGAFAVIALILFIGSKRTAHLTNTAVTNIDIPPYLPIAPAGPQMGGGGGGGSQDVLQAPKGKLPKFEQQPIVPPMVVKNDHPKLTEEPAIMVPKNIQLANNNLPNLGDPRTSVVGPASNGTGANGGMGSGSGGGIGSGGGNGYGPGQGGGYGSGLYHVGGGVSAPTVIYAPEAEFSDEARRAKHEGECVVSLIVDAQGNPQRVQVVRHLGMGLDEKALEAVRQYKFKPAMLQGKPVPVEMDVVVDFRIY